MNIAATMFYDVITYYFKGADTDYSSSSAMSSRTDAEKTAQEIVRGGIVLLKNEPDAAGNTLLPLATSADAKTPVNLFGWDSVGWIAGGSGSGSSSDADFVDLPAAMEAGNYEVNQELIDLYRGYMEARPGAGVGTVDWTILEMPVDKYTDVVMENAKTFSDVAFISIGRMGGEGNDLPTDMSGWGGKAGQHYLELSDTERDMVELVCANFDNVVVLINSASTMELGWVDEFDSIRSVVYTGMTGAKGLSALPEILSGDVNPSGRTADLYAYDLTSAPSFSNAGAAAVHTYTNTETSNVRGGEYANYHYIEYQESIYIGYRYYETRGATDGEAWYADHVQYPFGYGLSYTTFEQKLESMTANSDGTITVEASVRNIGDVSGRDVVELYYTAPYTEGGIEKSHVVLLDFAKTDVLEPAQEQTLTFTFSTEDMASYDYQGAGCYVLEAGDYEIKLMANSHDVLDSKNYTVSETITFGEDHKRTSDKTAAVNLFNDAAGDVVYLSRADWEGTWPKGTQDAQADANLLNALKLANVETYVDPNATMPTTGAANNLTLTDMIGLSYEDAKWDSLLDQMTVEDMFALVSKGGYQTEEIASIGKPHANDLDGPQGINESNQSLKAAAAASYPAECLSGCTWDVDILELMGQSLGKEALAYNVNGWYAPAVNLHRSPFGGRVFEYYSEDPVLSGKLGAACVAGARQHGVYAYVKHFAL
ncbi:MAG: glycoside hydrolase family 3 C-terminal domain-containing protein, partial [Lachnospiraceae bacterium]|nr:glycoside hydrolase family 3 C-terminal domain-containing protein [Lachnospiraceae bacterium]